MIMKTSFVCLLLVAYMGVFYYANKHLPIKSTRIFSYYYVSAFLLVVFDLITLYTVNHMDSVPGIINTVAHVVYLLVINTTVYLYFLYLRSLLESYLHVKRGTKAMQSAPFLVTSVLIMLLPLEYIEGIYTNYSMGAKVYALYASVILYNIMILYYCIHYWQLLSKEKRVAILVSVPIFFGVTIINITMPEALFSIVYVILTTVGLMMSNENNEKYLDKQTGMFNQYALGIVSSEYQYLKRNILVTVITISEAENVQDTIDWRQYVTVMEQIQTYCRKELKRQAYRVGDNGFAILTNSNQAAEKTANAIIKYASDNCGGGISLSHETIALNDYTNNDTFMSKIVEICMDAINNTAVFDCLTGVKNRNSFEKELMQIRSNHIDTYYLIADLNNLKETNDAMGHSAGDELLRAVAKLLVNTVGKEGTVFRQGGDEFAVLWKGEDIHVLLDSLSQNCAQLNRKRVIPISYAIGYGKVLDKNGIDKADKMMYEHKRSMKENKEKKVLANKDTLC